MNNIVDGFVEVEINDDDFLKVKETLSRIGIASKKEKRLYQSCNILHKKGHYYIVHFKEMFMLDGKISTLSAEDLDRRDKIACLLHEWNLLTVINYEKYKNPNIGMNIIKIVPFKDKDQWIFETKYNIGKKF